jgi:hypothetical protein
MNWKLILQLSLFGLAMAFATVFLIPSKVEPIFWLAIFLVCAAFIARKAPGRHFLHGLCVSLLNCVWITSAHILFFETYVARHPEEAAMMAGSSLPPRLMMLITGPVIGVISGLILGVFAWVASKLLKPVAPVREGT